MAMTHLTDEQNAIVAAAGNLKINAVAGSGKTSTLLAYARARPHLRRILYLAFNRSVRLEAQRRCSEEGIGNVEVQTAHSLAFRQIVPRYNYRVIAGYKAHEIVELLGLGAGADACVAYAIANHLLRYAALFCNQATARVDELDYGATVQDEKAAAFVKHNRAAILDGTRRLLAKMDRGEIGVSHEFYLKKFQLARPVLAYDCVLFDEGQDASPVMLDIFMGFAGTRVIVGDAHQQIYGWRHAVNAMGHVDFNEYPLTTSFRFSQKIADLAMECLSWKQHFTNDKPITIRGAGKPCKIASRATLARTNLFLLRSAINAISSRTGCKKVYFEGNLNSYTYAAEGASIYDVLNLYTGWKSGIKDPLIKTMASFDVLKEYADEAEDMELGMLIDIVSEYGKELPGLLKELRQRHVADAQRERADMIFSTVHRCKGMEYDEVTLENDFITEARLKKILDKKDKEPINPGRLAEEINLAYVALTRTRGSLRVPEELFPNHPETHATPAPKSSKPARVSADSVWLQKHRSKNANAYRPWTPDEDRMLQYLIAEHRTLAQIAGRLGRKKSAISSRIKKKGLEGF